MTGTPHITPAEDDPLLVTGAPVITGSDGKTIAEDGPIALWRCGVSTRNPFCDGSHVSVGFSSAPDHSRIRNTAIAYSRKCDGTRHDSGWSDAS